MSVSTLKPCDKSLPLVGCFDVPFSASGRFVLPEEWRSIMAPGSAAYVLPDEDVGCLLLVPANVIQDEVTRTAEQKLCDMKPNQALKMIGEHPCVAKVDQDGCIEIPEPQRKYVGTQGRIVLFGVIRMIKIHDAKKL